MASESGNTYTRGVREPVASPDVALKRGVTCLRGVGEPARCGIKTWRHVPMRCFGAVWRRRQNVALLVHTWSQAARWHRWSCTKVHANGLTWRCKTWRQNVASHTHVVSASHVAMPDAASKRGVRRQRPTWGRRIVA